MRKHDDVELPAGRCGCGRRFLELTDADELRRRERADGDHESRREQSRSRGRGARRSARSRSASGTRSPPALASLPGKQRITAAMYTRFAKLLLVDAERVGKPAEHPLPGRVGERPRDVPPRADRAPGRRASRARRAPRRSPAARPRSGRRGRRRGARDGVRRRRGLLPLRPVKRLLAAPLPLPPAQRPRLDARVRRADRGERRRRSRLPISGSSSTHYDAVVQDRPRARARARKGAETHHYFVLSRSGKLRERIEAETAKTISMLREARVDGRRSSSTSASSRTSSPTRTIPFTSRTTIRASTRRTTTSSSTSSAGWRSSRPSSTASTTDLTSRRIVDRDVRAHRAASIR